MKLTLLCLGVKLMFNEALQNGSDMANVILKGVGVNEDIVDIHNDPLIEHVTEYVIDESFEGRRTIDQPERHYQIFIVACYRGKGSLPLISFTDSYQVVCTAQVEFCEILGGAKLLQSCRN